MRGGVATLYRVPILGGTPQRVIEDVDSRISFSPDRTRFAFVRGAPSLRKGYVMVANVDGTGGRELASIGGSERLLLHAPSWSPDGSTILASVQSLKGAPHALVVAVDATTGAVTRLEHHWTFLTDIEWLPDGRSFAVVASEHGDGLQIWQVPYPQGERRRITNDLNTYTSVSFSGDGNSLLTVQAESTSHLWVAPEKDLAGGRQITRGRERADGVSGLTWTPDGRLVYGSSASGRPEVWISNADGSGAHQLTNEPNPSMHPDVTPDGRHIVFHRFTREGGNIWRMGIDGSDPKQLTHSGMNLSPHATNAFVYYVNPTSGWSRPWKVPLDGGDPVSLGDHHLTLTGISPDGTRLVGIGWDEKERRPVTAIMPVEGGPPQFVPEATFYNATWSADGRGVTYWGPHEGALHLFRYVPGEKAPRPLARFTDEVFAFAWSPDGKQAALARGQASSDVVLITRKTSARQ
ncbi:MAG TPA: hypothetical protein VNJ03_10335 [Vicinamibacterales bacterium]|nr:hypothetical protein [Vicinamibacterales bacterium]